MPKRTRTHEDPSSELSTLEEVTDEDIELFISRFEEDDRQGFWNLPTAAGLGLIGVGIAYLFQQLGFWDGVNLEMLANMLPWLAGILIILIGFGLLSREKSHKRVKKRKVKSSSKTQESSTDKEKKSWISASDVSQAAKDFARAVRRTAAEKHLTKSHDKKIAGVCAGLGEYFDIDPTLVRIGFVVATVFGGGAPVVLYLALMFAMPGPDDHPEDLRIRITRE